MRWDRRCWLVVVVMILGTPSAAFSQSGVWTNPLSGLWSAPANWAGGTVANGAGNTADFSTLDITGDVTVTLDTPRTIGTLLFGDTAPTHNWSISGANTLTLAGGTPTITVNNQSATINSAINFAASGLTKNGAGTLNLTALSTSGGQTLTVSAGTLNIAGASFNLLSGGGNPSFNIGTGATISAANTANNAHNIGSVTMTGGTLTSNGVSDAGFGNWLINGNVTTNASATQSTISATRVNLQGNPIFTIADGAAATDLSVTSVLFGGNLTKNGLGTMVVNNAGSDFSGRTVTVNAGVLEFQAPFNATSFSGGNFIVNGGTVNLRSVSNFTGVTLMINGGALNLMAGDFNVLSGNPNIVIGVGATVSASNTANNAHNIGSVTLTGGTLTSNAVSDGGFGNFLLNGNVTTNASATQSNITATRISLQGTRTFTVADGVAATDLFVSSQLFNGNLVKEGAGVMALAGNNTYGTTTINAGILSIGDETNLGSGGGVTINGGILRTTATFTIDDGAHTITIGALGGTIETAPATTLTMSQSITATAGSFFKTGTGTLDLTVGSNFTGQSLNVVDGTMQIVGTGFNVLGGNPSIVIGTGATLSAANTANNAHNIGSVTLTGGTLTSNAVSDGGFGNFLFNGNVTTNASATQSNITATRISLQGTRTFTVADGAAATDLFVSSQLFNGNLVKEGAGVMTLAGNNTYGTTTINAGTLSISDETNLGSGGGVTINGGILRTTATFTIDDGPHTITTGAAGGTVQTAAGTTLTMSQPITATAGAFFKTGTGTLDLTAGSNFAGQTLNVMEGTMRTVGAAFNILGFNQNIFIGEGATLSASNTANNAHNFQALSMTGGTLTSSGAASEGGFGHWLLNANVTINASTLQSTISAGRVNLQGTRTFTVANGAAATDLLVSSELFNGELIKDGPGLMTLSGNNTYAGTTTINAGILSIDAENRLGVNPGAFNAAHLTLNGGTLQTTASFAIDDANRGISVGAPGGTIETATGTTLNVARPITSTAGVAGLTKTGAGTMDLTVGNNFTNSTLTVNAGTVNITSPQTFSSGTLVVNNATVNLVSPNTFNLLSGGTNANIVISGTGVVNAANTIGSNAHNIGSVTFTGGTLTSNAVSDAGFGNWLINGNVTTSASATQATISATRVALSGSPTFTIADGAAPIDMLVSSVLFGGNLTKNGAGLMRMSAANDFDGRTVTVNAGTLEITGISSVSGGSVIVNGGLVRLNGNTFNQLGLGAFADVTIGAGGTVDAASTAAQNAHNIGALTLTGGTLTATGIDDAGNGNFLLQRNVTVNGAVQSNITANSVNLVSAARTFTVADGAAPVDLFVSSRLFGGGLTKNGTGTMVLSAPNNALSVVNVNAGVVRLESSAFNSMGGAMPVFIGEGAVLSAANTANNAHNIGALTLTGGTLTSAGAASDGGFGHWLLNGNVTTNASATQANITAGRVSLQGARTFTVANGTAPVDLLVSSQLFNGSLIKQGAGLMSLTNPNIAYNGTTTIAAGTLRIDGTHNGAGTYTVISGATLGGSGTINLAAGAIVNVLPTPGIVSPGPGYSNSNPANIADVGTLTINATAPAALALDMNGILQIDIVSPLQHDVLNIATGVIDIDPNAVISINGDTDLSQLDLGVLGFENGDRVTLLLADQILGNFANFPANQSIGTAGGNVFLGNDGVSLFLLAVPEPGSVTLWLLVGGLGVVGFCLARRKHPRNR